MSALKMNFSFKINKLTQFNFFHVYIYVFVVILVPKDLMMPRKSKRSYTVFRDDFNSFNKASYTIEVSSWGGGVGHS